MEMLVILLLGFTWGVLSTLVYLKLADLIREMQRILDEERAIFGKEDSKESASSEDSGS